MGKHAFQWLSEPRHYFEDWEPPTEIRDTAFAKRRMFFERNESHRNGNVVCPACGYPILRYRNGYDYCSLCHWEDDGQDDPWADQPNGGPNDHSLKQARENFEETFSVWAMHEAEDFHAQTQARLFSAKAQKEKRKLCALYDALIGMEEDKEKIYQQWLLIEEQWKVVP